MLGDYSIRSRFGPSRSTVISLNGMVCSSQPLASQAGMQMLMKGGNAIDAAVAAAAVLNVVEPMSTGVGGDLFAMVYMAKSKELRGLNASGRSPYAATRQWFLAQNLKHIPATGMLSVTVPGALDGWITLLETYGTMSLAEVIQPAIEYAAEGFAVTPIISQAWHQESAKLISHPNTVAHYLSNGRPPKPGEIFKSPALAKTLRLIAEGGREVFYRGEIARAIVKFSEDNGGLLSLDDLKDHTSTWLEPISTVYRGYTVYELPPNGQGLIALMALNILEGFEISPIGPNSDKTLHLIVEALKLAFADNNAYVTDPEFADIPVKEMLSERYAKQQCARIDLHQAAKDVKAGEFEGGGRRAEGEKNQFVGANPRVRPRKKTEGDDTVYLCAVDKDRNAISFINSISANFGSGMVAAETGILLQNRGASFSLDELHWNRLEPHKRTRHTIIPAMLFKGDDFLMTFGVMGGDMQPQGHLQVVCNILDFGMNLQDAIDAPRVRIMGGAKIVLESGLPLNFQYALSQKGHEIMSSEGVFFGGGQAIAVDPESGALLGASDHRRDGCAIGY